jgi:hypothetical protein
MSRLTYGEELFESYLRENSVVFEREPELPGISQRVDYVVNHLEFMRQTELALLGDGFRKVPVPSDA